MKTANGFARVKLISLLTLMLLVSFCSAASADDAPYFISLDSVPTQLLGHDVFIGARLTSADTIRGFTGFDLTIAYDRSGMNFRDVQPGDIITDCDWEYFTYEWGSNGDCHGDCPEGVVRIVGTASLQGGISGCPSPIPGVGNVPKTLFTLKFLLTTDRTYECTDIPVRWYWLDCRDNVIQTTDPAEQVISARVLDWGPGFPVDITDSTMGFPTYQGAQTDCSTPGQGYASRLVDFYDTYVPIICPDTIDARGDINANQIPYEIADYIVFTSYFMDGLSAFTIDPAYQIATSDINADGIQLHVSDLVYFGLIINGDAAPFPKLNTEALTDHSVFSVTGDTVNLQTTYPLGGVFLKFPGDVHPTLLQSDGGVYYNYDDTNTNVLILGADQLYPSHLHTGPLLSVVPQSPEGRPDPILAQASDTLGMYVTASIDSPTGVDDNPNDYQPAQFTLGQNYPNPFNPTTTINFTLPRAGDYTLTIFNMLGQSVQTLSGSASAGTVSVTWDAGNQPSGVYLYRLQAGTLSTSKKMLLMK